jgi:hypothetical protein
MCGCNHVDASMQAAAARPHTIPCAHRVLLALLCLLDQRLELLLPLLGRSYVGLHLGYVC